MFFGERITSKDVWPPRSPNNSMRFSMKGTVYKDITHSHLNLKDAFTNVNESIPCTELLHIYKPMRSLLTLAVT
jgi:hypothetical protein